MTTGYEKQLHECFKAYNASVENTNYAMSDYLFKGQSNNIDTENLFYKGICPATNDIAQYYQSMKNAEITNATNMLTHMKSFIKHLTSYMCQDNEKHLREASSNIKDKLQKLDNNNDQALLKSKLREVYNEDQEALRLELREIYGEDHQSQKYGTFSENYYKHEASVKLITNLFEGQDVNQKVLYDNVDSLNKSMEDYQSELNSQCINYSNNIDHILSYIQVSQTAHDIL